MSFFEWVVIALVSLHVLFYVWTGATNWQSMLYLKLPVIIIDLVLICYILYANGILII